jgi:DNA-binding CsgD family transcriptional regulator
MVTQLSSDLTKHELVTLLELIQASLKVNSEEEFKTLLSRLEELVPSTHTIICLGKIDADTHFKGFMKMVNVSYPLDWIEHYMQEGYAEVDPILRSHFGRFSTQIWSETYRQAVSPREQEFIKDAGAFGLSEGITLGVACHRNGAGSVFSFAGKSMSDHARHATMLQYLIPHLHVALMRTLSPPSSPNSDLSYREREVLDWMKEGKTSWEISHILHISERTVNFHVQNILSKLQASTRGHAIALAIQQGLIGP